MNLNNITVSNLEDLYMQLFNEVDEEGRIAAQKEFNKIREQQSEPVAKLIILDKLVAAISSGI